MRWDFLLQDNLDRQSDAWAGLAFAIIAVALLIVGVKWMFGRDRRKK